MSHVVFMKFMKGILINSQISHSIANQIMFPQSPLFVVQRPRRLRGTGGSGDENPQCASQCSKPLTQHPQLACALFKVNNKRAKTVNCQHMPCTCQRTFSSYTITFLRHVFAGTSSSLSSTNFSRVYICLCGFRLQRFLV